MIGIYKIISPTNRVYIGQSVDIERRFNRYTNLRCKGQIRLYNSFIKHGVENHIFEVIEECEESNLNTRERYYQEFYNVLDNNSGLNCRLTNTNDKSGKISEYTRLKMSENNTGHMKGRKLSEETKNKIKNNSARSLKVICTKTGKIWNSIKECAIENNINYYTFISYLKNRIKNKTSFILYKSEENEGNN